MVEKISREEYLLMAKVYESTERFPQMVESINNFVEMNPVLSKEERSLLNTGYKNIVAKQRVSWRELATRQRTEEKNKKIVEYIIELRLEVEKEILGNTERLLAVIDKYLIPNANDIESKVLYFKMKGDFLRFRAEVTEGDEYEKNYKESEKAYFEGYKLSEKLPISNPVRLGLALNFSVLYYEVILKKEEALKIAKDAYDKSMTIIDDLDRNNSRDTILIIQLLKENLGLWNNDNEGESDK